MPKRDGAATLWDLSAGAPNERVEPDTIGIASSLEPQDVIHLVAECGMEHVVQRDGLAFEREVQLARMMVMEPAEFFSAPLDAIFGADAGTDHFIDFAVTCGPDEKKKHVLHQLEAYLKGLTGARSIREEAMMVADELYTNGAKNGAPIVGPVDASQVKPGWVRFIARADGMRLVLGCIDSYGALDAAVMVRRIQSCFKDGVAQSINQSQGGGAGIGSYMAFNAAMSMYVAVERGRRTIVLCALPLSKRLKETINLPKNFHVLTRD